MFVVPPSPFRSKVLDSWLVKKTGVQHSYGCLMAMLPKDIANEIVRWSNDFIPDSHLGVGGREDEPHVTIKYGFRDNSAGMVRSLVSMVRELGPIPIKLGVFSLFRGNKDGDVLKVGVSSPVLVDLNKKITESFDCEDKYPQYLPHATVAYINPNFASAYTYIPAAFLNREVLITELEWSPPEGARKRISLGEVVGQKSIDCCPSCGGFVITDKKSMWCGRPPCDWSIKSDPKNPVAKESYFATCERDKEGHCLPSGQSGGKPSDKPKGKPSEKDQERLNFSTKLVDYQTKAANSIRKRLGKPPLTFELKLMPIGDIKPSQTGEDYDNASSRQLAKYIADPGESGRKEDYAPIAVDENFEIIDGNHRHAAHVFAGLKWIPTLVPVKSSDQKALSWLDNSRGGALVPPPEQPKAKKRSRLGGFIPQAPRLGKSLFVRNKALCEQGERSDLTGCTPASGEAGQKPTQGKDDPKPNDSSSPEIGPEWPGISSESKQRALARLSGRYDEGEVSKLVSEIMEENLRGRRENPGGYFSVSNEDIMHWAVGEAVGRIRSRIREQEKEKYKALRESQLSQDVPPPKGYPGSKAQVNVVSKRNPEKVRAMLSSTFGKQMQLQQVADLVGAPDDAVVSITPGKAKDSYTIRVKHPQYAAKRTIYKDEGKIIIHNDEFFMKEGQTGTGLGTEVLAKQIDNARSLGVAMLECHAGGPPTMNGYYTWPRFGYDQDLKSVFSGFSFDNELGKKYEEIQKRFPGAETVGDIMLTDEGREWWKKNGVRMHNAEFDLSENSRSLKIFTAYLEERKSRKEGKKSMSGDDVLRGEIDDIGNGEEELPLSKEDEEALERAWKKIDSKQTKPPTVPKSPFRPKE